LGFYTRGGREPYGALVPFLREFLDDALFDNAGNTKIDAENRSFIYDSEDKQVEVRDQANTIVGQYFYNGDGQRIKKVVPSPGETIAGWAVVGDGVVLTVVWAVRVP
jgi:hypothetical protein